MRRFLCSACGSLNVGTSIGMVNDPVRQMDAARETSSQK
jgi:hypothetical protein